MANQLTSVQSFQTTNLSKNFRKVYSGILKSLRLDGHGIQEFLFHLIKNHNHFVDLEKEGHVQFSSRIKQGTEYRIH